MPVAQGIRNALSKALGGVSPAEAPLEHPSELKNGDYATGIALKYAKQAGKKPRELAEEIAGKLGNIDGVERIEVAGAGFINFYLAPAELAKAVENAREEKTWGRNERNKGKKIMVEYTDPNPFKEFHIGHLMSNAIGESVARLIEFTSANVKRANYQGDVGPHVAKAIWGLQKLGLDATDAKALGKAYAAGASVYEGDKKARAEIDAINALVYDRSDKEINRLYDVGRKASLEHFEEIYKMLGTTFDFYFFESETASEGLKLVRKHPEVFVKSEGAIVYHGPHTRVFITSKGLPTYETKELGLAKMKAEKWTFNDSITVTAHEQSGYFEVVIAAMREVMPELAPKIRHVSHGMMRFAEGKMSSRKGNVITGESLLAELTEAAGERAKESRAEDASKLAEAVAVGAIKYQILKQASGRDIIFDRERALSLEGDSGPYLQYAHVRAFAVVEKAISQGLTLRIPKGQTLEISESARNLARLLHRFPEAVERAAKELEPHLLTNYLLEFASAFNRWYANEQILDGTPAAAHKVALTDAIRATLKNGLWLLGIPTPEKM
ncbi:arginine--tRNA ligase [Candidatus Kaiserbacteria bacterium RIFCSPLOWO2_01_FULL_54_13]|uniref:Arginine--tRNA ligase n=1 Tax=Candidatus Kaiserbacteria bacterium RIFCSPLOWO2_01_FULL_54_13 TaxID=1798512 RepID=A0A1F6F1M5_9BACT|nr:MAG: arginine--tRNA ligase [Candidatus Kaiserbacteria bacterium RIFCSPLOWO2_01_FULL_54_13]